MNAIDKENYINRIEVDSLLAFKLHDEDLKLISGKVTDIFNDGGETHYNVQTKNGTNYLIPKRYIAWVNTNGRWPKGVMNAFKIKSKDDTVE